MSAFYILIALSFFASWFVGQTLKSKYKKYSRVPIPNGMSGAEVAYQMLSDHGIRDVNIVNTSGALTDHYDPRTRTIKLSDWVYSERSIASAAVAAHEVGHAVQHASKFPALEMRSNLVPFVMLSSRFMGITFIVGLGIAYFSGSTTLLFIALLLFGITTLFSVVTLPVEFNASKRALAWIEDRGLVEGANHAMASDALKWAALTYVVKALSSLGQLFIFIWMFLGMKKS